MKVNDPSMGGLASSGLGKASFDRTQQTQNSRASASSSPAAGSPDQVQLSSLGSQIQALSTGSPERTARVQQLAAAVAGGTYKVDAQALSRSIVDDALSTGKRGAE